MNDQVSILSKLCSDFGITHVVICPGSRSAPLVLAFNQNKNFKTFSVIDERSAAYIALGMAQQLKKPVALICTSGTAALNFYPAIAEAFYQKIPLVVLTADRPANLLNQQDGQMINQVNVFNNHVRASIHLDNELLSKTNWQQNIWEALNKSNDKVMGPVHMNVPLVEPLYENFSEAVNNAEKFVFHKEENDFDTTDLSEAIKLSDKKIILVGQGLPNEELSKALIQLQNKGFVVLADVVSNQHENSLIKHFDFIVSHSNAEKLKTLEPDLIVSLGGAVLSKALKIWLKAQKPRYHFRIQTDDVLVNTYDNVSSFIFNKPEKVLNKLEKNLPFENNSLYQNTWQLLEEDAAKYIEEFTSKNNTPFNELIAVNSVLKRLPQNSVLQVANSTSIRYVSNVGLATKSISVFSNRGTSGIDGCTSTAIGAANINKEICTLITGDLAFFYDRNAFWNNHVTNNLRVILLNNNGGGIFNLIDGPNQTEEFETFFLTKHRLNAKNLANEFGLFYENCSTQNELENALSTFFDDSEKAKILELSFNMNKSAEVYKKFKNRF